MFSLANIPIALLTSERVAKLDSVVKSLEKQLEEQSRDADHAISQWYTALEVRRSEMKSKIETLVKEKEQLLDEGPTGSEMQTAGLEQLHVEKERLEQALSAASENLNQEEGAIHGLEGEL
jgi:hypothetical protein